MPDKLTEPASPQGREPSGSQARKAAAAMLSADTPWKRGVKTALRRYLYLAAPTVVWCIILKLGLFTPTVTFPVTMVFTLLVFLASIPLGLVFRVDSMIDSVYRLTGDSVAIGLLAALGVALVNYMLVGALMGWLRGRTIGPKQEQN